MEKKRNWFKGLKAEFKKCVWPTGTTLVRQTIAVVAASVVIGVIITIVDTIIQYGLDIVIRY